jgi:hypothetical protein
MKSLKIFILSLIVPLTAYTQDTLQEKTVSTKDSCQDIQFYHEKLINGVFFQRDLLYSIYQLDSKLLDIKDSRIEEYQKLDTLQENKAASLEKVISNNEIIIADWTKLYKKEKRRKTWSTIGFSVSLGALGGLFVYRELTR